MKNLGRFLSEEIRPTAEQKELLLKQVVNFITSLTKPSQIYFFGSVLEARFDQASDIDVVAIYDSPEQADQARRLLYGSMRPAEIHHALEILCVGEKVFAEKSNTGGIYWVARNQGRAIY